VHDTIQKLADEGQSIWCDNISRGMIDGGELQRLIDLGIVGVTSNPTIFMKAITGGTEYDAAFQRLMSEGLDTMAIYEGLVIPDIIDAADMLRPIYGQTQGEDGYVSLEVNPQLAYGTDATIQEARRLWDAINRPNIFIKVPATQEGIPAIEALIADGINVNVTLIFSGKVYEQVMQAYLNGLRKLDAAGGDLSKVASVASFFVSRVDSLVDKRLTEKESEGKEVGHLYGQIAVANARLAYKRFEEVFDAEGEFGDLADKGARVQRPLWASTSTKNPDYPDTMYVDELVGPNTVNTLPPDTIDAVLDHGSTACMIRDELENAAAQIEELGELGISIDEVTEKLRVDGVKAFADSFSELIDNLTRKQELLDAAK